MIGLSTPYLLVLAVPIVGALLWLILRQRRRPILRAVALLLLVIALAGPRIASPRRDHNIIFLVDRSASVRLTSDDVATRSSIQDILEEQPDAQFATVEFARTAALAVPFGSVAAPIGVATLDGALTHLDAAVSLALSVLPDGAANQLVLVSDGRYDDDVEASIDSARTASVPISVLPIGTPPATDVSLVSVHGPSEVEVGRPFTIDLEIDAELPADATLVVYRDDDLATFEQITLEPGRTRFSITDRFEEPLAHTYQAIVKAEGDPIPENDALSLLVTATDRPSVLLVDPAGTSAVPGLLASLGLEFTPLNAVPSLEILSGYRQLVLTGLSLATLTADDLTAVESFVRDLGGGLLLIEGEEEVRAVASGGIEEILPVSYTMPEKSREAQMALVFVLDRSSSMRARVGGVEKIEILKEAAAASAALVDATTYVGILAFNLEQEWVVPIAPVESADLYYALRGLEAIGGTDVYYPIVEALDRLKETEVPSKHILLISDGKTVDEPRNYPGLIRRLQESDDVTLSAIGVGRTMNAALLGALVEAGGGTLYRADDFSLLPQVSIQATQRISRRRFIDGPAEVAGRLSDSFGDSPVPALDGYVLTYPKPSADTSLWAGEDPIVSTWRPGLGAVTVLNTDLIGSGSSEWLAWPGLSSLFEAILATTQPYVVSAIGLSASVLDDPETTEVIVDARDAGAFANFLELEVELLPDGATYPAPQVGPGLYASSFATPTEGGYALHLIDHTRQRALTLPFSVPYPDELRDLGPDRETLERIAEATGGAMLEDGASLPSVAGGTSTDIQSLHMQFLLAALGVFLLDLIVRKRPSRGWRAR